MRVSLHRLLAALLFLAALACAQRPIVRRPESTRAYTTALTIDGGGMRCLIPSLVAVEIEESIKRYLLNHPEYLPEDEEIETADDFDVLLADYFDAMSGVSGGSWTTGYLASKGGEGAADAIFRNSRIRRRYGRVTSGQAKGLEIFFMEFGERFYPGGILFNVTPPTIPLEDVSPELIDLTDPLGTAATAAGLLPGIEIPGLNAPFFPHEGLERTLERFYGDVKLSELSTYYVVHAYDLIQRHNVYFVHDNLGDASVAFTSTGIIRREPRTFPSRANGDDFNYTPDTNVTEHDFYLRDLVRASSALPGFHEAKMVTAIDDETAAFTLIDGAAITNNPALQLLIFLTSEPHTLPISQIAMISLGTGIAVQDYADYVDSSTLGWLINNALFGIIADGAAENAQQQVDYLFYGDPDVQAGQYLRIQTTSPLETESGEVLSRATEPSDLPRLRRIGRGVAERYRSAIDRFVEDFIFAE